ncbi:MAG: Lsr2 family protein [Nocardioides sp.]
MAQKVSIILVDDLDGSEATETVSFGLDGASYEIDLNDAHATSLREAMAGYVGNARKVTGTRRRKAASSDTGPSAREVRDWARSNGFTVPDRGRIPGEVRDAFDAAN